MAFPTSPNVGDQHTVNAQTYEWNGAAWDTLAGSGPAGSSVALDTTNFDNNLSVTEDTVQKALDLIDDNVAGLSSTNTFTAPQIGTVTTDNDLSFDLSVTNNFSCTPSANGTLTFTNMALGQSGNIVLDNTGGYIVAKDAAVLADSSFLTTISAAGIYWVSYSCTATEVYVTTSGAMS